MASPTPLEYLMGLITRHRQNPKRSPARDICPAEVVRHCKVSRQRAQQVLQRLVAQGLIVHKKRGMYTVGNEEEPNEPGGLF